LPLGVELAAAWVRTIPCAEIAVSIEREAAALFSLHANRAGRHRNLDAVIAYSWNLLTLEQQNALAALGIFVGGFTRDATERVAVAPLRMLSSLVDKSLVRRHDDGRYDLHELVRQFALTRLRTDSVLNAIVSERYRDFFSEFVASTHDRMRGPDEMAAVAALSSDLANVMSAWNSSIDSNNYTIIASMAAPLVSLLQVHVTLPTALAEAERAVRALGSQGEEHVLAAIRMQWGRAAVTGGDPDVARRELTKALTLARRVGRTDAIVRALHQTGSLEYQQGNIDAAEKVGNEALSLLQDDAEPELRCLVHNLIGTLANMRSRFDIAERHGRLALAAAREQQCPSRVGSLLCNLGVPLCYMGKFSEASAVTAEACTIYEMLGRHVSVAMIRSNLAAIAIAQNDIVTARQQAQEAVRLTREAGDGNWLSGALTTLSDALCHDHQWAAARSAADEGLQVAETVRHPLVVTEALFLLATIDLEEGHHRAALKRILRLRDVLVEHHLTVRVPMLVLAAAQWARSEQTGAYRVDGRRWLNVIAALDDVDATLRDKARRLLEREAVSAESNAPATAIASLGELEAEIYASLARIAALTTDA
jgi:tetratricopeptide (TPR) repeat protein